MTWQHGVCFLAGALALLSQHWWDRKRARLKEQGREYVHFDYPVAITLVSLAVPMGLDQVSPQVGYLWWSWAGGALVVALPTVVMKTGRRGSR